jgi:hypothetical protein
MKQLAVKQAAIENYHEFACHRYRFEQMQSGGICGDRRDTYPAGLRVHP